MGARWTIEQVVALAPAPARFVAAEAMAVPARWSMLGADAGAVWGRCRGSGREPYDTTVDHAHVAWRCSCPSRSQPCKHALALLAMWVRGQVPDAVAPAAVASWVDAHGHRDTPSGPAPAVAPTAGDVGDVGDVAASEPPVDRDAGRDERIARLHDGLVELDRWLDDRVRTGLADPALARYATWDDLAARLVDARAGALANRVRRLAGVVGARPDWHEVVLTELGVLHLLARAGRRLPELPSPLADAVATACGWPVRRADVLAGVPDTDTWRVLGRSDTREDRIEVRRTWLRGETSGRWAMVLSFAAYRQSLDDSLPVGRRLAADLHRYPGPSLRSLVGLVHDSPPAPPGPVPAVDVLGACDEVGAMLAAEPWADHLPVTLGAAPTLDGGRWVLGDETGALALAPAVPGLPTLLAASAGAPVAVTLEWTAAGAVPLTVHLVDRDLDIGPRADPSFAFERGMTAVAAFWDELITASLLGTDRRDPPVPPAGPLADLVADAIAPTPSERMLTALAAGAVVRRAGLLPRPRAPALHPPAVDERPLLPAVAARRWRPLVRQWAVLEDEWLLAVAAGGWRLPPDVLVGLLRRHRADGPRRALVVQLGGPVAPWLVAHQPTLAGPGGRPVAPLAHLPALAVPPTLLPLLVAGGDGPIAAIAAGLHDGSFAVAHRGVLVNFVARMAPGGLAPLAEALGSVDDSSPTAGLAHLLAGLAGTRRAMLEELT